MPQFATYYRPWSAEAVASTDNVVSPVLDLRFGDRDSWVLSLKAVPTSGTADVKIEVALSSDGVNFDSYLTSLTASSNTQFSATPHDYHEYPIDTQGMLYAKIKVTGVGSNPASTKVTATLNFVESFPSENQYAMVSRYWDDAI